MAVVRKLTALLTYKHDNAALKRYEQQIQKLKNKISKIPEGFNKSRVAINNAKRSTDRLGQSIKAANHSTANLTRSFVNIHSLITGIGASFAAFTGVNKIDNTTNATARLNQAAKLYGVTLKELEEQSLSTANQTRTGFEDTSKLFFRLSDPAKKTGKSLQDISKAVSAVQAGLVIGGASTQESQSSILQLSQALQSGELMGEELRSLRENAGFLMQRVADSIGVPIGALKEMGSQGQLTSEIMLNALIDVSDEMNSLMKEMPVTFGQSFTLIGNKLSSFIIKVSRESNVFGKIAIGVNKFFNNLEAGTNEASKAVGGFTNLLKALGLTVAGGLLFKFGGSLTKVRAAGTALISTFALLGKTIKLAFGGAFLLLLDDINNWRDGQKSVLGQVLGDYESFKLTAEDTFSNLFENTSIGPALMKLQEQIDKITFESVTDSIFEFYDNAVKTITNLQNNLSDFLSFLSGDVDAENAALAPILSPQAQAKQDMENAVKYNLGSFGFGGASKQLLPNSNKVELKIDKIEVKTNLNGSNAAEASKEMMNIFSQDLKDTGFNFSQ